LSAVVAGIGAGVIICAAFVMVKVPDTVPG
jgi:hypothetical protein